MKSLKELVLNTQYDLSSLGCNIGYDEFGYAYAYFPGGYAMFNQDGYLLDINSSFSNSDEKAESENDCSSASDSGCNICYDEFGYVYAYLTDGYAMFNQSGQLLDTDLKEIPVECIQAVLKKIEDTVGA